MNSSHSPATSTYPLYTTDFRCVCVHKDLWVSVWRSADPVRYLVS